MEYRSNGRNSWKVNVRRQGAICSIEIRYKKCGINKKNWPEKPSDRGYADYKPFLAISEYTVWLVFVTPYLL
jgi:hypothetical protein